MYISNTEEERKQMLAQIGVEKFEDLIKKSIPAELLSNKYNLPEGLTEIQAYRKIKDLSEKNKIAKNFVGAGVYERYIPAALKNILSRNEYVTAYTPYQAEASQGILQTIYEYQSTVCALYEMDCSNASMYDGSTSFAEALKACVRITQKKKILYSSLVNKRYIEVAKTYFSNNEIEFIEIPHRDGKTDLDKLKDLIDEKTAAVAISNPNFLGSIEDIASVSEIAKKNGALSVCAADPISLSILQTPGSCGFDFAVGEGQSLGLPMSYGGPYLGIFTCKKEHLRQMPGRICGMTKDKEGKRGFVLTLQAREQHIRRDKAPSNICSNQALCALNATVYCALLGPSGLKKVAYRNNELANKALEELIKIEGIKRKFNAPFFNEFVIDLPVNARELRRKLVNDFAVDPGLTLEFMGKDFENSLLVCLTETKEESDIIALKVALKIELEGKI